MARRYWAASERYCTVPRSRPFIKKKGRWHRTPPLKVLCGKLLRVTSISPGDIRQSINVGIITVRGVQYAVLLRDLRK